MAATFGQFPANFRFSGALVINTPSVIKFTTAVVIIWIKLDGVGPIDSRPSTD